LPVYEQRRQVLAQAGLLLGPAPRFELRPPDAARAWAEANVPDSAIHLSINASSPFKEWPVSQWTGLLALLRERGLSVVATCAMESRERERLDKLAAEAGGANLRIFAGLDIPRLTALLSRCRLHIGADSGAIHLAMALGLPTVGIFRDYAGRAEWTPVASPHRQVSRPCRCSSVIQDDCGRAGTALCLAGIMPDQVFTNGVELLLGQVTAEDLTQRRRDSEGSRQN
jgi:heptosyltransferase-2/heptosyltransferase-3